MQEILDFTYQEKGKDSLSSKKHTHTYHLEILHVCGGTGTYIVNDRILPIKPNTMVLINGMDNHCSVPADASAYIRSKLVISKRFIDQIAEITDAVSLIDDLFTNQSGLCIELSPEEHAYIDRQFQEIHTSLNTDNLYSRTNMMIALFRILICTHRNLQHTSIIHNKMSDVLQYLNAHLQDKLELEPICEHFHISKYYLCHTFKKTVGMTIGDYVLARRISVAKRKLIYTDMPLSEIALSTGFSSFSYFSKVFKEFEGVTPKEFRKNGVSGVENL